MFTRLPMIALSLGSMLIAMGCESVPFDYYPHHEAGVACQDVHKNVDPGDYGGTNSRLASSIADTNPATGPATSGPTSSSTSMPAMSAGR